MADDKRIDLGLSKIISTDTPSGGDVGSAEDAVKENGGGVVFDPNIQNHLETENWQKLSELSEVKSSEGGPLTPYYRSLWVRAQVELKSTPVSILVAPLDSAQKQFEEVELKDPQAKSVTAQQIKKTYSRLAAELKEKDQELYLHCLNMSGQKPEAEKKEKPAKKKEVKSQAAKKKTSTEAPRKQWMFPVLVILLIGAIAGVAAYGLASKIYDSSPVSAEIDQGSQPETDFPSGQRVGVLKHLDAIYYETGAGRSSDTAKDIDLEPLAKKQFPWEERERQEVRREKKEKLARDRLAAQAAAKNSTSKSSSSVSGIDMSGPVEPTEVRQRILAGEPVPSETEDQGSIVPLRPDSQAKRYRLIARSKILVSPDYQAQAVGTLYPDQEVQVVEEGRIWLKLKAKSGRYGYILAQDAVRAP